MTSSKANPLILLGAILLASRSLAAEPTVPALLTEEPYAIPNLGLSVYLPEDTLVDLSRIEGGRTTVLIVPQGQAGEQAFVFQIMQSISADRNLTLAEAVRNIIEQRRSFHTGQDARGRTVSTVRVFDPDDNLLIGQHPAHRVYLDVPLDSAVPVTGYTVFNIGPGQFVIFQMDCPVALFPKVRQLYELMIASVQFRAPEELGADRAAALLAGKSLLARFNAGDYQAAIDDQPVYYRIYRPGDTGPDEEIGYQRVQTRTGHAADVDPDKPPSRWTAADKAPGFIVRVDARALAAGTMVDSVSLFFLAADRESELWSIRMVVRKGDDAEQWRETGIRTKKKLTVKTARSGREPTNAEWSPIPDSYLSRVETYLLPPLVARAGLPGAFGFYTYDSNLAKMTLRRETFAAPTNNADETSPALILTTLPSENSRPITTLLDPAGRLLKRTNPDGQITEPIDQATLRKIWMEKKLPLE